jgi:pre-mRNA cleavage complex 2 protein Pcf11
MPSLRNAMQSILDDLQSDEQDELNKVSLERLAIIDEDLIVKIKQTAEDSLNTNVPGTSNSNLGGGNNTNNSSLVMVQNGPNTPGGELSFLIETRTSDAIDTSKTWMKLNLNYKKDAHDVIASLQQLVLRDSKTTDKRYTQIEAIEMTGALATAAVTASLLTSCLQEMKDQEDDKDRKKKSKTTVSSGNQKLNGPSSSAAPSYFAVDKSLFTNDGIRILNEAIVGLLYDVGLPFISSADGRRFASQLELSKHLDALFKKGQLEKTMAITQERGWYLENDVWSGEDKAKESSGDASGANEQDADTSALGDDTSDPSTFTVPADESRDRCVICGINFKMVFDNDDGIYKYTNCREMKVSKNEAAATDWEWDDVLVHVTCWRNLGSPDQLTDEQTLHNSIS